jgi:polyphosphate kinase
MSTIAADTGTYTFLDRDLSWLEFNRRVLHEALDPRTPLLERAKFLAIFGSNLDEFSMKRVGRLLHLLAHSHGPADEVGATQRLQRIREVLIPMLAAQADTFTNTVRPQLAGQGIHLLGWTDLSPAQESFVRDFFHRNVFSVLTPLAVDPAHPFPFISNLSTSLGILLSEPDSDDRLFARVKLPNVLPRWVPLPTEETDGGSAERLCFVHLLDIIRHNLEDLFTGMVIREVMPFRVTRNAYLESDEDEPEESLAVLVEEELRKRRFESAVRLEYGPGVSEYQVQLLLRKLNLAEASAYAVSAELDYTDLLPLTRINRPDLHDSPWQPVIPPALADEDDDIFTVIRGGDLLVHHPYESFDASVARFIRRAAEDPQVLALKMTVYRAGADTPFLDALIRAAEAGKQVACLVEVRARFDEQQNLQVAHALEKAGIHVAYGLVGLKTHCKTTLVVRQEKDGLRCYAHIGTGNYHVKTARLYTDLGLFTCDPVLTEDVVNLFHYLTGHSRKRDYAALLVAPVNMRQRFLEMIRREVEHHRAGRPARIIAQMNQLEDRQVCEELLKASQAGVEISLIVRGFCTLRPGVAGVSDRIHIHSVIGRFLEHERIYYFQNGEEDPLAGDYYIGSADWMSRNLSDRVEAITPIRARPLRQRLWEILQVLLSDQRQAWDLQSSGSYVQRQPPADGGRAVLGSHQVLMNLTRERAGSKEPSSS